MAANTTIEWTDRSWNPVRGCSRVSPGCDHCYAMNFAHRFSGAGKPYEGLTTIRKGKVDWSGVARFIPGELDAPLRWRKPQRIFVNSMSDLFHNSLSNEQIAAVFGVMAACPRHTFQILTKRPERAVEFFSWVTAQADGLEDRQQSVCFGYAADHLRGPHWSRVIRDSARYRDEHGAAWPVPWVWLGVSVENQATADERIPLLLKCPASVRWISAEPLLGPLALGRYLPEIGIYTPALSWVVVGGESGPGARPFDVAWARSVVEQCREASLSVFVKQLGSNVRDRNDAGFDGQPGDAWDVRGDYDRVEHNPDGVREEYQGARVRVRLASRKGGVIAEWPEGLRVREFPEVRT